MFYLWVGGNDGGTTVISNNGETRERIMRIAKNSLQGYEPFEIVDSDDGGFTIYGKHGMRATAYLPR